MMTNHKATSLVFGLAVLLYSAQSLTATDEKQQIKPKITFLVIYRPDPAWLPGKSVSEQPLKGAWNVHAGPVRKRFDEARRTTDGQRWWNSCIGGCRRI